MLAGVFGSVALLIAAQDVAAAGSSARGAMQVPRGAGGASAGGLIGGVSAVMGIGGGTLTVPTLNLCGYPIHRAVGTAAFFGIFISIPGTVGYLLARPPVELPWATVGFVSLVGLAIIAPGSMLTAALGARVAHSLSRRRLSQAFGVFLLLVGSRMLYRALRLSCGRVRGRGGQRVLSNTTSTGNHRHRAIDDQAGPRSRSTCGTVSLPPTAMTRAMPSEKERLPVGCICASPASAASSAAGVSGASGYGLHFCGGSMPMRPAR